MEPSLDTLVVLRGDCRCGCHEAESSDGDGPALVDGVPCGCGADCMLWDGEYEAFCPLCGERASTDDGAFVTEDYVNTNCLLWCSEHREVLLCLTKDSRDIGRLRDREPPRDSCAREVSPEQAAQLAAQRGFSLRHRAKADDRFFRTASLYMARVGRPPAADDVSLELGDPRAWSEATWDFAGGARCFAELPPEIDTSHDGAYLLYEASCAGCGLPHRSYIWGD